MALVVLTGGARSGKSAAAQALAQARSRGGSNVIVAAFGSPAGDSEFAERIARHRAARPDAFTTVEATDSVSWTSTVPDGELLLLDCLGTLLGRAMEDAWSASSHGELSSADAEQLPEGVEEAVRERLGAVLEWLLSRRGDTIVVTNEVGDGMVPAYATGRLFRDLLGSTNRTLVQRADAAYLVLAGRLIDLKSLAQEASWPGD